MLKAVGLNVGRKAGIARYNNHISVAFWDRFASFKRDINRARS